MLEIILVATAITIFIYIFLFLLMISVMLLYLTWKDQNLHNIWTLISYAFVISSVIFISFMVTWMKGLVNVLY